MPQYYGVIMTGVRVKASVKVRFQGTTMPKGPGILRLQKACQDEHDTAPTLVLTSLHNFLMCNTYSVGVHSLSILVS